LRKVAVFLAEGFEEGEALKDSNYFSICAA
jgi:hypothetical protein